MAKVYDKDGQEVKTIFADIIIIILIVSIIVWVIN